MPDSRPRGRTREFTAVERWIDDRANAVLARGSGRWRPWAVDAVVFLLSPRSGVVTGSVIEWDQQVVGGQD